MPIYNVYINGEQVQISKYTYEYKQIRTTVLLTLHALGIHVVRSYEQISTRCGIDFIDLHIVTD